MEKTGYTMLGALARGDQRLAMHGGRFYLFDHSGSSPDTTDDGPLYVDLGRAARVDARSCSVPVVSGSGEHYWVGVTHQGMLRLRAILTGKSVRLRLEVDEGLLPLVALFAAHHADAAHDAAHASEARNKADR